MPITTILLGMEYFEIEEESVEEVTGKDGVIEFKQKGVVEKGLKMVLMENGLQPAKLVGENSRVF